MKTFFWAIPVLGAVSYSLSPKWADDMIVSYHSSFKERKADFLKTFGSGGRYIEEVEQIAESELKRFDNHTYLDYTGSSVYTTTQLQAVFTDLETNAFGNAHSRNPSADLTDNEMDHARRLLGKFFNFTTDEYAVVFTSGATGSLKLVGEDFPWSKGSLFYYLRSNHNSVLGIREYAVQKGGTFKAVDEVHVTETLKRRKEEGRVNDLLANDACLFSYPLKDNFAGIYYPEEWINDVHRYGLSDNCRWYVLLDSAAYAATNRINASQMGGDFYALSFYKLFGFPTGLGLLLMRQDIASDMQKLYWGGGTVVAADCDSRWCKLKENPSMRFEDGTASFLSIVALKYGFEALERVGYDRIAPHVASLSAYVGHIFNLMHHKNGAPVIELYTHSYPNYEPPVGGVLAFNVLRDDGSYVNFGEVEGLASFEKLHLRTGCFCNPGACANFLGLTADDLRKISETRDSCGDPNNPLQKRQAVGAVRASFGYLSTFADADRFVEFVQNNFVE